MIGPSILPGSWARWQNPNKLFIMGEGRQIFAPRFISSNLLNAMMLVKLAFLLFFFVPPALASQLLPLNPYGATESTTTIIYVGVISWRWERLQILKAANFSQKFSTQSTPFAWTPCGATIRHLNILQLPWCDPLLLSQKGTVCEDFVVPSDGFAFNTSDGTSFFIFFGPKRISDVDALKRAGFPDSRTIVNFHKWSIASILTSTRPINSEGSDQVFLAVNDKTRKDAVVSLKSMQTQIFCHKDWQYLVCTGSLEKCKNSFTNIFPLLKCTLRK